MSVVGTPAAPPSRARQLVLLAVIAAVLAVLGWRLWVHGSAQAHFRNGKALLDQDKPDEARGPLDECLKVWPRSGEAHFFAARAARRTGDLDAARRHLNEAVANGWSADAIELERSLLRVQEGDYEAEEPYLLGLLAENHPDSAVVLEVLTPLYFSRYHLEKVRRCVDKWVELRPGSSKAWSYRGEIADRFRNHQQAVASFREAVRLDPSARGPRTRLAGLMLDGKQPPAEVEDVLAPLLGETPADPTVTRLLIRCREAQGRLPEAIDLADKLLQRDPHDPAALHLRGRLEFGAGRAATAAPYLREAAARNTNDIDLHYTLWQCLTEVGPPEEARAVEARLKRLKEDLQRLRQLAGQMIASPHDADLRREAGEIALRNGLEVEGVRWLESALQERPDDPRTHLLLADYYARTNRPDLADYHRSRASAGGPAPPGTAPGARRS